MEWLGRQDSNLRMAIPKTAALPLGYAPIGREHNQKPKSMQLLRLCSLNILIRNS